MRKRERHEHGGGEERHTTRWRSALKERGLVPFVCRIDFHEAFADGSCTTVGDPACIFGRGPPPGGEKAFSFFPPNILSSPNDESLSLSPFLTINYSNGDLSPPLWTPKQREKTGRKERMDTNQEE
jgi:hypothetical protein